MPSSFSTDLKLELMVTGENAGTWGDKTNTNLNLLQQAIAGYQDISIAGGAQTTALTMDNATISNARNAVIKLTGTITGNQIVTVPDGIEKTYIVQNGTVGVFTVQFKTASGTGVTFASTNKGFKIVYSDGTNIVDVELSSVNPIIEKILDTNGNEEIIFTATASAVNELTIANAATGNAPEISSTGDDTNIDLKLTPKGTGKLNLDGIKFPNTDGSAGQRLTTNGSGVLSFTSISPSITQYTSGSGTYTVPSGAVYLQVEMCGAGGGGSGAGTGGGNFGAAGVAGGNSTFGSSLLTANGGAPGTPAGADSLSGLGGTATITSPATGLALQGGTGIGASIGMSTTAVSMNGCSGGVNPFGGGGGHGISTTASVTNAPANTGAGGIGGVAAGNASTGFNGTGGGAGGYIKAIITSPSATYSYAVGAGGAGGARGGTQFYGEAGSAGNIIITAYF